MIDPERLLHTTEDDFERRILRAAAGDLASSESLQRTLVAMGAVATKGAAATVAGTSAAARVQGAKVGGASGGAFATGKVLTALALGGLAGTVVTTGAEAVLWSGQTRPSGADSHLVGHPGVHEAQAAPGRVRRGAEPSAVETLPSREQGPGSDGPSTTHSRRGLVSHGGQTGADSMEAPASSVVAKGSGGPRSADDPRSVESTTETSSLASELAALVRVRAALGRHDVVSALGLLAEYDQRFPSGALGPEASVLRIEALFDSGERSRAVEAAERFLASHPGSPHEARLHALIAQGRIQ